MAGVNKSRTKRNEGAGSQQVSSSRRRPLSSRNATDTYCVCSLEAALFLFGSGGKFYNPRVEALLRGIEQTKMDIPDIRELCSAKEANVRELRRQYAESVAELKAIKRRGKELEKYWENQPVRLYIRPTEELNLEAAIKLKSKLEDLQVKVHNELVRRGERSSPIESCSSYVDESFECSSSIASGESESVDVDANDSVHGRN